MKLPLQEKDVYPCRYGKGQKVSIRMGFYKGFTGNIKDIEIRQGINADTTIYQIRNEETGTEIWQPEGNIKPRKILGIF